MWWIPVVLVVLVIAALFVFRRPGNAMGYTSEHGYCPNMGACDGCDICQED